MKPNLVGKSVTVLTMFSIAATTLVLLGLTLVMASEDPSEPDYSDANPGTNVGKPMWSDWTPWTPCSQTCGMGKKKSTRMCLSGDRSVDGKHCSRRNQESLHSQEVVSCSMGPCFSRMILTLGAFDL